jgi:ABC-type multidrug transport system fused ATPase/permease subunit
MFGAAGAIVMAALLDTGVPIFVARSLDQLQQRTTTTGLLTVSAGLTLLACLSWVANAVRQTLSSRAVGDVVLQLREDACDAVLQRDLSFYDTIPSGKIVCRVTSDTQAFSQVMALTLVLLSRLLLVVLLVGYLFSVSARLTLILLGLAPFIFAGALAFRMIARRTITSSRRMGATVSSHIQETVSGIGVAKTFRQEPAIFAHFLGVNQQSRRVNLRSRYVFSTIFPIMNLMAGFGTAALVYFGGLNVYDGSLTAGNWYLFIQGLALFWFPLTSIASFWSQFQLGLAAASIPLEPLRLGPVGFGSGVRSGSPGAPPSVCRWSG